MAAASTSSSASARSGDVVICVDAGGTKTLAVAAGVDSKQTFVGQAGCGNCATLGLEAASQVILRAVRDALISAGFGTFFDLLEAGEAEGITTPPLSVSDNDSSSADDEHDPLSRPTASSSSTTTANTSEVLRPRVRAIWIGSAGLSSSAVIGNYRQQLSQLLQEYHLIDDSTPIWITNDAVLLSAPMLRDASSQSCVCLIAGTGSAGFAFQRTTPSVISSSCSSSASAAAPSMVETSENEDLPGLITVSKTGGWGYLLGDRGSGWSIGLSTIQLMLTREEERQFVPLPLTDFERAVMRALDVDTPIELISAAYRDRVCASGGNFFHAEDARKRWLAETTRVVFEYAFEDAGRSGKDLAVQLLHQAVGECIDSISKLCCPKDRIRPERSTLVLGGGLWSNSRFLDLLVEMWKDQGRDGFKNIHVVKSPAHEAAEYLAAKFLGEKLGGK
ncbi:glucokinase regulator [Pseudozyma hubeiensis SY62]|uniref:Glucokinase regulator n=1 Tax=Pseudozyma hubeiensis (strain SY62) TaxID=1305764 RepID=R9P478_PSEHS|nr:glucokinase regulator [Pseudozyma hubeiensis SY62]GAC96243.1 glucokinase regulator [Pseudozyma hubeiensis SY62]